MRDSAGERTLKIATESGRWFENGRENQTVKGAVDIDLGWSPSTNTLPIRRLKLGIGQTSGEFIAAWVRFPELTLQPLPRNIFAWPTASIVIPAAAEPFVANLLVDEEDLVLDYEGFWQRARETK